MTSLEIVFFIVPMNTVYLRDALYSHRNQIFLFDHDHYY